MKTEDADPRWRERMWVGGPQGCREKGMEAQGLLSEDGVTEILSLLLAF